MYSQTKKEDFVKQNEELSRIASRVSSEISARLLGSWKQIRQDVYYGKFVGHIHPFLVEVNTSTKEVDIYNHYKEIKV